MHKLNSQILVAGAQDSPCESLRLDAD